MGDATAIKQTLGDVRGRLARARAGQALFTAFAVAGALLLTLCGLDNLFHLPGLVRALGSLSFVASVGWLAWSRVRPAIARAPTDDEVALLIERTAPDLDNRLVNAVQLGRERLDRFGAAAAAAIAREAAAALPAIPVGRAIPDRPLKRAALAALAAASVAALYAALLPAHLKNALARYARPLAYVAPLTRTRLEVSPGHVTVLEGETVLVRAVASGEVPARAALSVRDARGAEEYEMRFAGDAFAFPLEGVREPLSYTVRAGDAESEAFRIEVVTRPRILRMAIEYRFPDYLDREEDRIEPFDGEIAAVEGTRATVVVTADRPLAGARARLASGGFVDALVDGATARFAIHVTRDDRYDLVLTDVRGTEDKDPPTHAIRCLKDAPPQVSFREPAADCQASASAHLPVSIEAADDLGLAEVSLHIAGGAGRGERRLEVWPVEGRREAVLRGALALGPLGLRAGETVSLVARARDRKGQEASSRPLLVRIVSGREEAARLAKDLVDLRLRLRRVLELQRAAHAEAKRGARVGAEQVTILALTLGILADWTAPELRRTRAYGLVKGLASVEMPRAAREAPPRLLATQQAIVKGLEEALEELQKLIERLKKGDADKALAAAAPADPSPAAKDLLRGLKEFMEEQAKAIALTQELRGIAPEDLTDEQRKDLEALKATEEKWGKFLEEKATDLSKLAPQDFSNGEVLKELIEARSDVELAAAALAKKNVEIAVPLEEAGLELAKSITENLERWLADSPDKTKWSMEEPKSQPEVPLADLPAELEDLVGDLIDKEEEMTEETEDLTSGWMDSLNNGAGWTAMDGPISNMSAKGVTGNLNPNSNEIAGRSGEGRSGKSSGQMVEETATGKGGRQTPTRATPDPYEKGRVKDRSKDKSGGSTGGGKESGANREGLRGDPPPETQRKMDRLAGEQAELRNAAEHVKAALERRGYHPEDLKRAIERMRYMEDQLRRRRGGDYTAVKEAVVESLAAAKKQGGRVESNRDPGRGPPKELRGDVENALDEEIPREYEDAVRAYYRSLSEGR